MMFKNLKGAGEAIVLAVTDVRGKRGGDPYCSFDCHCIARTVKKGYL